MKIKVFTKSRCVLLCLLYLGSFQVHADNTPFPMLKVSTALSGAAGQDLGSPMPMLSMAPPVSAAVLEQIANNASPTPASEELKLPSILLAQATTPVAPSAAAGPSSEAGAIDESRVAGMQLGALPAALGFAEELPIDASSSGSMPASKGYVPSLNIASALALGVETSLELAASQAALRGADARVRGARAPLLPKLDLRGARGNGKYVGGGTDFSTNERSEGSLDLRVPLFFPAGWMELRRQKTFQSVAEHERDAKKSLAALDNGLAFLGILVAQARLNLIADYDKRLRELFEYIRARAAAGASAQTESNRVESRIVGVTADLSEARANLRGALSNYVRLTGHLPQALSFRSSLPPLPSGMTDLQIVDLAQDNPELMAARKRIEIHRAEILAGGSNFLPRVDFHASRQKSENVGSTVGRQIETKAMVVMTMALFSGGADVALISEANAKLDEQTIRSQLLERQLRADVETALAGLNTLGARYGATEKQVKLDADVIESFMDQLKLGNRPLLDVLDAQQRLYQSRQQLLLVGITQAQAFLRLSYLTGRLAGSSGIEQ